MRTVSQIVLWSLVWAIVGSVVLVGIGAGSHASTLAGKPSGGGSGNGGCPSSNAIGNFQESTVVGASVDKNGSTWTYFFSSLVDLSPSTGIPGLIQYCVYPSTLPGAETAVATGADGSNFTAAVGTHQGFFSFGRATGDPSNIPLDGTHGIEMGTGTWTGATPTTESIILHINDAAECQSLYGGSSSTCFVFPAGSVNPMCGGAPACKTISASEETSTTPVTVPNNTLLHLTFTFTIVNQPGNAFNLEFTPTTTSTPPATWTGINDVFTCLEQPNPNGTPSAYGPYANFQGTGLNLLFSQVGNASCPRPQVTLADRGTAPIVLHPGEFLTFTVDLLSQPQGLCEGKYIMNFGVAVHWYDSNDGKIHAYQGPLVGLTVA